MAKFSQLHTQDNCRGRNALEPIIVVFLILAHFFLIVLLSDAVHFLSDIFAQLLLHFEVGCIEAFKLLAGGLLAQLSQSGHLLCPEELCLLVELRPFSISNFEVGSCSHSLHRLLQQETATALSKSDELLQSLLLLLLSIAFANDNVFVLGRFLLLLLYHLILVEIGGVKSSRAINFF